MNRTSWAPACSPDKCPGLLKVNLLKTRDKTSQFSPGFTTDIFGGAAVLGDTPPHSGFWRRARGRVHPAGSWRLPCAGGAAVPGPEEILGLQRGSRGWDIGDHGNWDIKPWEWGMLRCGTGRTHINHREGRCWLPALPHSPPSALPRLVPRESQGGGNVEPQKQ